jgi:hypothetical protein
MCDAGFYLLDPGIIHGEGKHSTENKLQRLPRRGVKKSGRKSRQVI